MSKTNSRKDSVQGQPKASAAFARYDNSRFAVLLGTAAEAPLRGTAHFEFDEESGGILRIKLDGPMLGNPVIVVCEKEFSGSILPDDRYGCQYCLLLTDDRGGAARARGAAAATARGRQRGRP